jgi:hypothetical protein
MEKEEKHDANIYLPSFRKQIHFQGRKTPFAMAAVPFCRASLYEYGEASRRPSERNIPHARP